MNRRGITVTGILFLAAFAVAAGCGGGGSSNPTNPGGGGGGPSFDLRFPATGASQQFTFTTVGTWDYHCTPHQNMGMTGTVTVSAMSSNDSALVQVGPGDSKTFSPSAVTIKPNGHVRWVNASSQTIHTVTRP